MLASDQSHFINGAVIAADDGFAVDFPQQKAISRSKKPHAARLDAGSTTHLVTPAAARVEADFFRVKMACSAYG
jgi:hypothetical protein